VRFLRPLTGIAAALMLVLAQTPPVSSPEIPAKKPSTTKAKTASKTAGATKPKAKTTGKAGAKTTSKATSKTAGAKKSAAPKTAASAAKKSSSTSPAKAAPVRRPVGQQRPTAERYKEIETALHERGYLTESPSGQWAPSSVEALRRFQADQDLPVTGHLDSLSLIRLGLGPQRQ
jgi:hypothetical protein